MTTEPQTLPQWKTETEAPRPEPAKKSDVLTLTNDTEIKLRYDRFGYATLLVFQNGTPKPEDRLDVLRWFETETAKALDVLRAVIAAEEGTTP